MESSYRERMKDALMEELMKLAENVPDKYDDFIIGIKCTMKNQDEEDIKDVMGFMKSNPQADTSDILDYLEELGI